MNRIFLDNNGTTEMDPRVIDAMIEEMQMGPSNPSSIHSFGRAAQQRLSRARESIADYLGVQAKELIFTSSGTEALNLAIFGLRKDGAIITSKIEHAAVYQALEGLPNPIVYLPVGVEGHVKVSDLENAIERNISLIILSAVNTETGVKNPLAEIAAMAEIKGIPLIVDGVGLLGKEIFLIPKGVTAMAFSSHKIHGPKGVGLLFCRKGNTLEGQIKGGAQEGNRRAGTENLAGIIGFAKAVALLKEELPQALHRMETFRNKLEQNLKEVRINGTGPRICNTSSLTFSKTDGEDLLIQLDMQGIAASMGSACTSGALEPSRVLLTMGLSRKEALSTLRFSLSRFTTEEEIEKTIKILNGEESSVKSLYRDFSRT